MLTSKTFVGLRKVVALKTSTHTYVAEGLASHNCFEEYEYSKRVLSGSIEDETRLPIVFEAAAEEDWTDPQVWRRVNPGHGVTVKHEGVAAECREAQSEPRKLNDFLMYTLNRWVNQATAWITVDSWDAKAQSDPIQSDDELKLLPCSAGLDLAQKWDFACFSVVCRWRLPLPLRGVEVVSDTATGAVEKRSIDLNYGITIVPFFWLPEDTMRQHEKDEGLPCSIWKDAGLLTVTDGPTIDYSRIYRDITEIIVPRFPRLKQAPIGYDPAFATDIASKLADPGGLKVMEVLQNYQHMSEPCHIFEALNRAGRIRHGGHRILRNHIEHVAVKRDDAGRIRPVKPKRAGKHIDGVVSSLMGLKMLATVPDSSPSLQLFFLGGSA